MNQEDRITQWHQTIDFDALMSEARKHITALSGKIWTDHNSSDPGITIMEVLAFCIADLSYRTSFGIKDIMAGYKGDKLLDIDLPLPSVILPNRPVTITDLRKLLLDMSHPDDADKLLIRNVAPIIATESEIPFYAVSRPGSETFLSYTDQFTFGLAAPSEAVKDIPEKMAVDADASAESLAGATASSPAYPVFQPPKKQKYQNITPIELNGLYDLQIDFEENIDLPKTSHLRNLNQSYFTQEVASNGETYQLKVLLPYWDEVKWSVKDLDLSAASLNYLQRKGNRDYFLAVDKLNYDDHFYDYYAELSLSDHLITCYVKQEDPLRSSIRINQTYYHFSVNFLDWNEFSNGVDRQYAQAVMLTVPLANAGMYLISNVSVGDENIFDIRVDYEIPKGQDTKKITLLMRVDFDDASSGFPSDQQVISTLQAEVTNLISRQIDLEQAIYDKLKDVTADLYKNFQEKLREVFRLLYQSDKSVWKYLGSHRNLCEDFARFSASRVQEIALFGTLTVAPGSHIPTLLAEVYFQIDRFLHPLVKFQTLSQMTDRQKTFEEIFNGPSLKHGFITDEDLQILKRKSVIYTSDLIHIIMEIDGVEAVEDFSISSYIDNRLLGRNVINCLNLTNPEVYKPKLSYEKSALKVKTGGEQITIDKTLTEQLYDGLLLQQRDDQIPPNPDFELPVPLGNDMEIEKYRSIQHDFPEVYGIGEFGLPGKADAARQAKARQLKAYLLPFEQLLTNYLQQIAHLPELFSFNRNISATYAVKPLYDVPEVAPLFRDISSNSETWEDFKADIENTYRMAMKSGESEGEYLDRRNRFLSHQIARFGETFHDYAVHMFSLHKDLLNTPQGVGQYQEKRVEVLKKLIRDKINFAEDHQQVSSHRYGAFDTTVYNRKVQVIGAYKLRLCRLLGLTTEEELYLFGKGVDGKDLEGLQVLEHILLRPRYTGSRFMTIENRLDEDGRPFVYRSDEDPYSFRVTVVLPIAAGRFANAEFRNFTERLIRMETPAHILVDIRWMSSACGVKFEKAFIAWKSAIKDLVPYYFQGAAFYLQQNTMGDNLPDTILSLQDQLIKTMETPCKPDFTLYDDNHTPVRDVSDVIRITKGVRDIYHIRVSSEGGTLTVKGWVKDENSWVVKASSEQLDSTYLAISKTFPEVSDGLVSFLGDTGLYRVTYTDGEQHITKDLLIEEPVLRPSVAIGRSDLLLDHNFKSDGTFSVTSDEAETYYLYFEPGKGEIRIANEIINEVLELPKDEKTIGLQQILDQYGPGKFEITYSLNEYRVKASIEIIPQLKISIVSDNQPLETGDDGITRIPWTLEGVSAQFDYPGGLLKVYQIAGERRAEADQQDIDGTIYQSEEIAVLYFDDLKESVWQPGGEYELVYQIDEKFTSRRIVFEEDDKEVPKPELAIKFGDEILPDGHEIRKEEMEQYVFRATPVGGRLIVRNESEEILLEMETETEETNLMAIGQDLAGDRIDCTAEYFTEGFEDQPVKLSFTILNTIVKQATTAVEVIHLLSGEAIENIDGRYTLIFDYEKPDDGYQLIFDNSPGSINILKNGESDYFGGVDGESLTLFGEMLNNGDYEVFYDPFSAEPLSFGLSVININPVFQIQEVIRGEKSYLLRLQPVKPDGKSYVWRVDGEYISQEKEPEIEIQFSEKEQFVLSLTIHLDEYERTFDKVVTEEELINIINGK